MKPLLIVSHVACSRPGYLCDYLDRQSVAYRRFSIESGEALPSPDELSGLVLLGAPVSVNSDQHWIEQELGLIRDCAARAIPVFGICFGGQLISKAFGGEVFAAPAMQIGWHPITITEQTRHLFNGTPVPEHFSAFEWHEESFTLPAGAVPLFNGDCIGNQGFLHRGCLAVQFHPEVTEEIIHEWVARYEACVGKPTVCVQDPQEILLDLPLKLAAMRQMADNLFDWWLGQVGLTNNSR
ncbi:type 1 glutamine amidotransferase [Sedimenticola hydrogenitrophicus]|uniref:type 1 glutamine amidotransferase n=1 Tax=Sedimenticola hydrogenitrophicus TaxID=2967975 RepID=UPI0021A2FC58|nr:type 1 glutamine amidotransferase [Sedimenticola hydrogenitrophicus]